MSEFLGNLAARALGLSAVARPRPSIFEPRRAAPEPLALEPEAVSVPHSARAEEAPRAPTRPKRNQPAREAESQARHPTPSAETEAEAPPVRALPAEMPAARTHARAAPPPGDGRTNAPAVAEQGVAVLRAASPAEPAETPADTAIMTTPSPQPTRVAPWPRLPVKPSFPVRVKRETPGPTVRVSIGRIEVRAVKAEEPSEPRKRPRQAPRISLDDYLGRASERAG
jgi:hypothetical protein